MYKTTHIARTNANSTVTTVSSTTTPDGAVVAGMPATHSKEHFDLVFGKSRVTDICEITVVLDDVAI